MGKKLIRIVVVLVAGIVVIAGLAAAWVQLTWRRDFSAVAAPAVTASRDPQVIARGEYVVEAVAHCSTCHGAEAPRLSPLTGGPTIHAGPFGSFVPPNLTPDPDTGIGRLTDAQLARVLRSGVAHDGTLAPMMLVGVGAMADEDILAVVSYLRSLPPSPGKPSDERWGFVAKVLSGRFDPRSDSPPAYVAPSSASVERGRYLANGPAACVRCHTARDPAQGFVAVGPLFAGDPRAHNDKTDPAYEIIAPNLTTLPHTEDQFVARFQAGRAVGGSIMPWENFQKLTEDDVRSLYRYLKSLSPVANDLGPARRQKS